MDILKLTTDDIRKLDNAGMREVQDEIRKQLAQIRMDIYSAPTVNTGKVRHLKKSLARVMTVDTEQKKNSVMPKGK